MRDALDPRLEEVLDYWFGQAPDDAGVLAQKYASWFGPGDAVDAEIRDRFGDLHEEVAAGRFERWLALPRGRLALVIVLDQFSRNLFRGDPRAFEHDGLARAWTDEGLHLGADRALRACERVFAYLPLEHSESLADQQRSVERFRVLRDEAPAALRARFDNFLDYAVRHHDVIARFGRFPHRNAILGRASTPAEDEFLRQPGSSF